MNKSKTQGVLIIIVVLIILVKFLLPLLKSGSQHNSKQAPPTTQSSATHPTQPAGPAGTTPNNEDGLNRNERHLILTKHARCRMDCRHITEDEIREILHDGNINYNKSELKAERGPKYALEGYLPDHQHLRVIFAPENDGMVVVTCIDLDNEWQCPSCN